MDESCRANMPKAEACLYGELGMLLKLNKVTSVHVGSYADCKCKLFLRFSVTDWWNQLLVSM